MISGRQAKSSEKLRIALHISVICSTAVIVGVFLIVSSKIIAKDGVFYIWRARQFGTDASKAIGSLYFGYSLLIHIAHRAVNVWTGDSVMSWVYCGQGVNLLCRTLACIPVYLLGRRLVGARDSFTAMLILLFLPYPAHYGSDVMRDWSHILFLSAGFLLLVSAGGDCVWWKFLVAGLISGFGYLIRVECAQLVIYGAAWLLFCGLRGRRDVSRKALLVSAAMLAVGFFAGGGWHMSLRGEILPPKLQKCFGLDQPRAFGGSGKSARVEPAVQRAEFVPEDFVRGSFIKGILKIGKRVSENLMYFFFVPFCLGLVRYIRGIRLQVSVHFYMTLFLLFYVVVLLLLHHYYGYISRRHVLPIVAFGMFFVVAGLRDMAGFCHQYIVRGISESACFVLLVIVGVGICVPKLVGRMHADKEVYLTASDWLSEHSDPQDIICVEDWRIAFYAERQFVLKDKIEVLPASVKYVVDCEDVNSQGPRELCSGRACRMRKAIEYEKRGKPWRVAIYEIAGESAQLGHR